MLHEILNILLKSAKNFCNFSDISYILSITIKTLNRFCDLSEDIDNFSEKQEDVDLDQKETKLIYFLKFLTFKKIVGAIFFFSGSIMITYYLNDLYFDYLINCSEQIKEYFYPKIIHKVNPQVVLVKATRNFIFYTENHIKLINEARLKRFKNFLKTLEEKNSEESSKNEDPSI